MRKLWAVMLVAAAVAVVPAWTILAQQGGGASKSGGSKTGGAKPSTSKSTTGGGARGATGAKPAADGEEQPGPQAGAERPAGG
ncbi:MAG TPA: hypothetical protein PLV92_14000, partial [Pirellulaceae bacterium]|nr:hypothetical protein [Pirellulaceae bacterium]